MLGTDEDLRALERHAAELGTPEALAARDRARQRMGAPRCVCGAWLPVGTQAARIGGLIDLALCSNDACASRAFAALRDIEERHWRMTALTLGRSRWESLPKFADPLAMAAGLSPRPGMERCSPLDVQPLTATVRHLEELGDPRRHLPFVAGSRPQDDIRDATRKLLSVLRVTWSDGRERWGYEAPVLA